MALDRFGGDGAIAFRVRHAAGEEIFELILAARAGQIFVRRHPTDGRFMHFDRVGDGAQRQRFQMRHALAEEILLAADDLARDLDDGLLPLVERLHQPVGAGQAIGEPGLGILVLLAGRQFDIIAAVDQHAGQGGAVDLDAPSFGSGAHEQVGGDRRGAVARKFKAGFGIIAAQLADHVGQILLIHPADAAQLGQRALGQQVEIGEQAGDAGVVAVGFLGL